MLRNSFQTCSLMRSNSISFAVFSLFYVDISHSFEPAVDELI